MSNHTLQLAAIKNPLGLTILQNIPQLIDVVVWFHEFKLIFFIIYIFNIYKGGISDIHSIDNSLLLKIIFIKKNNKNKNSLYIQIISSHCCKIFMGIISIYLKLKSSSRQAKTFNIKNAVRVWPFILWKRDILLLINYFFTIIEWTNNNYSKEKKTMRKQLWKNPTTKNIKALALVKIFFTEIGTHLQVCWGNCFNSMF